MDEIETGDGLDSSTFRAASFPQAVLGYDRRAVRAFLERVADRLDEVGGSPSELTREFAAVGERTSGILTAAEQASAKLRADTKEYAERLRSEAEDEARLVRLRASQKADELVHAAEEKADRIVEEAVARRRNLNRSVTSLLERRNEISGETQRLTEELAEIAEALRLEWPPGPEDQTARIPPEEPSEEPAEPGPPDQRETAVHDGR